MDPTKPGFKTSEFWLAVAAIAGKIVTLLVMANLIQSNNPEELTKTVTEIVLAIGVIWGLYKGTENYTDSRVKLKTQALDIQAQAQGLNRK